MTLNAIASHAENEARRAASLRRIAIVLRDLPNDVARNLLAGLSPDARQRVRQEVRTLVDVDPMERKRALESFTGSLKRQAARDHDLAHPSRTGRAGESRTDASALTEDELKFSHANRFEAAPEPSAPLKFLDQLNDQDLLDLLKDEHPQTKAVVLSSIEPARAARILPRLGNAQRQDMLIRIGRLQALPDEMLADLATSFQSRVERMQTARNRNPLQQLIDQNAIESPNEAAGWNPSEAAKHVPKSAVAVSPRLQAILAELPSSEPERPAPAGYASASDGSASVSAERLRHITRDESERSSGGISASRSEPNDPPVPRTVPSERSTDAIHSQLVQLPPKRLCEALGRVETRVAILALCGLPNKTADAAIACLPRAAANQVRQHLMSVGSMEIREIDEAKEEVARAASIGSGSVGSGSNGSAANGSPLAQERTVGSGSVLGSMSTRVAA